MFLIPRRRLFFLCACCTLGQHDQQSIEGSGIFRSFRYPVRVDEYGLMSLCSSECKVRSVSLLQTTTSAKCFCPGKTSEEIPVYGSGGSYARRDLARNNDELVAWDPPPWLGA